MNGINIFSEIFLDLEILKHIQTEDNELRDRIQEEMVVRVEALVDMLVDSEDRARAMKAAKEYRQKEGRWNEVHGV